MPLGFLLPFGCQRSLLGPSCSRWGVAPSSRSADRAVAPPGPQRGFHVPHERDTTGVGAPFTPRRRCPSGWRDLHHPAPAASQRPALHPAATTHRRGLGSRDIIGSSLTFTRPVFPGPVAPGWNGNPWATTPELRTPPLPATHVRLGTGPRTLTRNYSFDNPNLQPVVHSTRATSCRTVTLPVPGNRAVGGLGRAFGDVDHVRDAVLALPRLPARMPQCPPGAQTLGQLPPQRTAGLDIQRLINGLG